jgi:hypothetical protein
MGKNFVTFWTKKLGIFGFSRAKLNSLFFGEKIAKYFSITTLEKKSPCSLITYEPEQVFFGNGIFLSLNE